jgi:hypothetical protein
LNDDDRWRRTEPPASRASDAPDLKFNPLATGIGVFTAIAIPAVVLGYTRKAGPDDTIIVIGVLAGLLVGIFAGVWVAARGGRVLKRPPL